MLHNVSNRQILLAVLFILGSSTIFSQVNIKERVEIVPQPPLQKSSTEGQILFEENPVPNEGRDQGAAIIVVHPCQVTVTGSIEIEPIDQGGYPPTDLTMYSTVGGIVAWYKGYPDGSHYLQNGSLSYARYCGAVGVAMDNVSGIGLTGVTKNIGSASATIVFEGTLLRYWTFKATAVLSATIDESYDLASVDLTSDATSITQCQSSTMLHTKLRNNAGEPYTGAPCQSPQPPMTLSVQSSSDVLLIYNGQPGKEITLPYGGDLDIQMYWNYQGETENSTAVIAMDVEGRTRTVTVDLIVDKTVTGLLFDDAPRTIVHMLKAMVTIRGLGCGGSGPAPLADGTNIDLEITEGANWGFLRDPETGEQGTHLPSLKTKAGCVKAEYWAQGDNPSVWEAVKLRATSAEASATCRIDILAAGLKVTLGRPEIGFGDTTKVVVEQGNEDDGYTPIPTEWKTMYEIVEADTLGYFYAPDSSKAGSPLVGYYPETRFFAKNTSSPPDSMVLLLMITAVEPYGEIWDVKGTDGNKPLQGQVRAKTNAGTKQATRSPGDQLMSDEEEPPNLGEGYYYYGAAQLVVKKKEEGLDHFKVTLEKDTIAFTETSKIFVQAKDAKDADIALDASKLLRMAETTNEEYGTFIDKNGDTVKTIPAMLDNIPYGDAKAGLIRFAAVKKEPDSTVACKISIILQRDSAKSGEKEIVVKPNLFEILLGESKYFYLRNDGGKIGIDSTSDPSYEPKINEDVWFGEPVSIANKGEAKAGKRLGVYWEKRKPDGTMLAAGMIRLIGRYWSADSTYRVNLTATYNGRKENLTIEVKKPGRLGNIHRRAKDVFDNEISIDDSCIVYGGKFGVPPHFLKSQISIESPTRSFAFSDGKHETGFSPGYRYEPYTTQFDLKKTMRQNPFYIIFASMPEPPPPDHRYVLYMDYVKQTPVTVWYFVENYSQLLDPSKPAVFGMRVADGRMRFDTVGYRYLQREFDKLFNYFLNPLGGGLGLPQVLSVAQAADSARAQFASFLKTRWHGRLDSLYAQTRVAASYGLFQTLYSTALDRGYLANAEHLPEGLNVPDTCFPLSVRYQSSLMKAKKALGDKFECGNNWPRGFEASFRDYVYYPKWNLDSTYARKVSSNFSKYLPKK